MVSYNFQYDKAMTRTLAELAEQRKPEGRKRVIFQIVLSISAVVLYICAGVLIRIDGMNANALIYIVIATVFLLIAVFDKRLRTYIIRRSMLRAGKDTLGAHGTWTFSEESIETDSTLGKGVTYWTAIVKYGDYGKYIYIQRKDNSMYLMDRSRLSDAELTELHDLLEKHAVPQEQ